MRIALELERLRNPYSGLGQFCEHLARAIVAFAPENDYIAYVPQEKTGFLGESVEYISQKWLHKLLQVPTNAQIWHCVHQQSTYLPRASQTKVVLTIHDLNFLEKYRDQPRKIAYHTAALQRLVNRASGIAFISEYTRSVAIQQLSISGNIPQKVIHNGCPLPTMVQPLRPNGVSDAPFLFSIGIVQPKKNVEVLLPLLAQLPNYQLIIAGNANTPYAAELRRMAQELGVSHRFSLLGTVSEAEKAWLLQQMSALVFPSLQEGFGLPVIEAMHHGKPVFLSDCTSLPEVGGTEAYYWRNFAPESMREIFLAGMAAVAAEAEKATRIRAWAAQFTWERAAQQYVELYAAAASL